MDHEGLLLSLARGHEGVGALLQTFFSFLARRTDFFHILEERGPSMGFSVAAAEAMVAEAFAQAQLSYRLEKQPHLVPCRLRGKSPTDLQEVARQFNSRQQPCRMQYASPICRLAVVASLPNFVSETKTQSAPRAAPAAAQPPAEASSCSSGSVDQKQEEKRKRPEEQPSATSCSSSSAPAAAASRPPPQAADHERTPVEVGATREKEKAFFINPWNGAVLDRYVWSQSINEATCQIRLLELLRKHRASEELNEVNAKLLSVTLRDDSLRVAYEGRVIFEGKWCHPIQSSESFWVLEQKTFVLLTLEKKRELWWDCLLQGDPTIDTTKVESVKRVEDFDEATQGHIRKIVYEQRLKMQGLKTPEEIQQENILRQAWDMEGSPFKGKPFDPSVLKPQPFGPRESHQEGV